MRISICCCRWCSTCGSCMHNWPMRTRSLFLLAAFLVVQPFAPLWAAPLEIKLGVIQSLTGPAEEDGQMIVKSLRIAADDLNAKGEVHASLLVEDDATLPKNAVTAFEKLKFAGVDAIVGPSWSFLVQSVAPFAVRSKLVVFNTSNMPEVLDFTQSNGFLFTNSFTLNSTAEPLRRYLAGRTFTRAAVVRTDTPWSNLHRQAFGKMLAERGITTVEDAVTAATSNNDFGEVLPRLKAQGVDLVLLLLSRDDSESLLKRASEIAYKPSYFASPHTFDAFNRTRSPELYEGLCLSYPYRQLHQDPAFVAKFKDRFNDEPRIYADSSYDAVFILADAVKNARASGRSLAEALRSASYDGIGGAYRYSPETSLAVGKSDLMCVKRGKLTAE